MAKNKESINELAYQLAILSDSLEKIFPDGKKMIVFELNKNDFNNAKIQFNNINNIKKFNVEISGTEIIFIEDELLNS